MSVTGLCQICERETASHTCPGCGAVVCDDHWDGERRLCADCAAGANA
ncbi:hypothetical protein [Halobaculum magnesiiphilum]|uniref:HIT zinc finger n=1 Tax=Halobaculum magnesiiphilum TaxID=1017351 RepID=A0A8T8WCK8_9EURY|nr:hypothetical protein [Halobaculum magnesiiphilum]QZP37493.1 hypothetical protein K6T50_14645 [Halobaculum magnesiiphilum]